jgi:hypothetical protein
VSIKDKNFPVPSYFQGGPDTSKQISDLINKIWEVTHSDDPPQEMLSKLALLSGVAVAYLMNYRKLLEAQENGS